MEHIDAMTKMRESIGLQGYGQRDPLVEYKQEAYAMFQRLQGAIAFDTTRMIYKVRIVNTAEQSRQREMEEKKNLALKGAEEPTGDFKEEEKDLSKGQSVQESGAVRDPKEQKEKVGRNDPCPCGAKDANGRPIKYKKCCGK